MTQNSAHTTDVIIIGAGPVGLFAIFQAGMLKMKAHVIDALDFIGGQCQALYPEKPIFDIPAYPKINASDLIDKLLEQAAPFNPIYHLGQKIVKLEKAEDFWQVTSDKDTKIRAKVVIIAAGSGAFGPNRPPLADLEIYENSGSVQYLVRKISDYQDKNIVIAGGGDSAIDWAISLSEVASKISLIHRRDKFKALPHSMEQIQHLVNIGKIDLVTPYQLHSLKGTEGKLEEVRVSDLSGGIRDVPADILLPFFGLRMELGEIANFGLDFDHSHIKVASFSMETSSQGIFAIGDIATYPGKLKLILTGFAEAALALHKAYEIIYPEKALHFEYSTTKGIGG